MTIKLKKFFLNFSVIFFIAGITSFTAYNWRIMTNFQKLTLPAVLILLGLSSYFLLKKENYKELALFFACFMVGTLLAVFGQTYQTGADTWILFRNWSIFLIIPAIFSMYYSIFILFIIVICIMTCFGLGLYFYESYSFFIAVSIPAIVLIIYPIIIEKFKLNFNNFFYNSLVIPFYIFFNIGGTSLIFENSFYHDNTPQTLRNVLIISYPLLTLLIYLIAYKKYKKHIILPLTITTAGLAVWAFLANQLRFDFIEFFLFSLVVFITTFVLFIKTLPKINNDFIIKFFKILSNFLKFSILLSGLGFLAAIIFIKDPSEYSFLFLGIITVIASCYLPKILNYKEDTLDLISFLIGLSSLVYSFANIFEEINPFYLTLLAIAIFDIFYFLKKNKGMDLLFAPAHYLLILIFMEEYQIPFGDFYSNINLLSVLAILILPLQLIFSKKIEASIYKDRINRIFYGNNMGLLLFFMFFANSTTMSYSFYEEGNTTLKSIKYIIRSRTALIIINSVYVIYLYFKNRDFNLNNNLTVSNNRFLENKNSIKNMSLTIALIIIIQCFAWKILGVNFIILLILLYIHKAYKWTTFLLNMALCYQVFSYYYHLYHITLLQKAYYMLYMALALLIAYLIMRFFIKEEVINV